MVKYIGCFIFPVLFIYAQNPETDCWSVITDLDQLRKLTLCLDDRHFSEFALKTRSSRTERRNNENVGIMA